MFQSFSGSSRRPRQVNLSGQHVDPFAASGWGGPAATGTKKTVAAAQQERQHRQQERERLQATKRIQRTWRGHRTRRELSDLRRQEWDQLDGHMLAGHTQSWSSLVEELQLFLTFFNARNPDDITRLQKLSERLLVADQNHILSRNDLRDKLRQLAKDILTALETSPSVVRESLLLLLSIIIQSQPQLIPTTAERYYDYLAHLLTHATLTSRQNEILETTIRAPLMKHPDLENNVAIELSAYSAFAQAFLSTPDLSKYLGGLQGLAKIVDITLLSESLLNKSRNGVQSESRFWLLANFINLHRLNEGSHQHPTYMRALTILLSDSANEIVGRIDAQDPEDAHQSHEDDDDEQYLAVPLPTFVRDELVTLVDKESVTGLLAKFNTDYNVGSSASTPVRGDASLIASYALLLLRIFPRLGEEIRMWLYQGSVDIEGTGKRLPALLLFWQAMRMTSTFRTVCVDSLSALEILRPRPPPQGTADTTREATRERDWRAILLFLELYAFVLRFTDDEEFLGGGDGIMGEPGRTLSRSRESALPLPDVKDLTMFLKNLSFTMFFNAAELTEPVEARREGGIGSYFGNGPKKAFAALPEKSAIEHVKKSHEDSAFLGISGMTFSYVRGIVTRVLRMIYERDSRRRFLPKGHWLMTSRFDMAGFIPAVVAEEERQHEVTEEEDDNDPMDIDAEGGITTISRFSQTRRLMQAQHLQQQQQKAARSKVLAAIGPRLEILQNMPFTIPFATRVQIFRQFVYQDQMRRRDGHVDSDHWRMSIMHGGGDHQQAHEILSRHHAKIRRDQIFEDAFRQFYGLKEGLKEPIQITFVDKFDTVEAGIDGGGVTKEFLTSVTNEAFRSEGGPNLFVTNDQNLLYPNPAALDEKKEILRVGGVEKGSDEWHETLTTLLKQYEFLGRIIGKCLYEGILVDISFASFFLLKWASTDASGSSSQDSRYLANINDLRDLDESLYQGLLQLKDYPGDVEDFSLDFTINDTVSRPEEPTRTITRELLPNGSNIPVTNENRVLYVSGVARHRLHAQPFHQTRAFLRGVAEIINPSWLSMFNQAELQTLIGGDSSEINVDDLRSNTAYGGVYVIGDDGLEHPTVQTFWKVMKELDDVDRRKVLKYVTSTPRAPLLGFGQLNPRFSIRDAGADEQRLPSTSTCINLLKLPRYTTVKTLKSKLLYAVNSGAGFDLS